MSAPNILVVDDEPQIRRVLRSTLSARGYVITEAKTGEEAVEWVRREPPDLVLLDVNMAGIGGIEACRQIRGISGAPIIMLTVRNAERDKVLALDAGADDYVVKPFSIEELLARIRAALRRYSPSDALPAFVSKDFLVANQGKPLTHRRILQSVWGPDYGEETENLRVVINQLRRKIEVDPAHPKYIITEPWVGYRFQPFRGGTSKPAARET